ncbi:MAG: DUF177 domain-containing protein [Acidobacteria bacterium]|nr:DUF177 domain-containing protein [Acidobacteriota bacterium]
MIIDLKQLEQDEIRVVYEYPVSFQLAEPGLELNRAPAIDLTLRRTGSEVHTAGRLEAVLSVTCDRCLNGYILPISAQFDLYFASENSIAESGEFQLDARAMDCSFYRNDQIEVDGLVREQILLALPHRHLCREDCRGLCAHCGADLNQGPCHCPPHSERPQWDGIRELFSERDT